MWLSNGVLVYETQDARIKQHIPAAIPINGQYVGVPVSLPNLQIMRLLGFPVIRPLGDYDWPRTSHIKQPFHAQVETANFLVVHPRAAVLSDMGTGKTLSALWAADALMSDAESRGESFRALVVAPLSTLSTVWLDAIFANFMSRRKAVILHGSAEKRIEELAKPADFYLLNHDGIKVGARINKARRLELGGFAEALAKRTDIRLVVIDEVGAFRAYNTLRSRVAKHTLKREFLWLMTGTPTPNGPLDAYGIAQLLNGARGESFTAYKNRVMYQVTKFDWRPKAGANEAAQALMQPSIRFSIEDCQDLPELTVQTREVELSGEQKELIKLLRKDLVLEMEKGTVHAVNEASKRTKLIQICCGCVYDEHHRAHHVDFIPRIKVLRELIEEAGSKVVVFAPFTSVVHRLNECLKDFTRCVILGETSVKDRTTIIKRFQQEKDPHVLIAQPETISHGQTLTAAATIVWFGPIDKTDVYIQACKRIHRPGQNRPCTVVNLAGSRIERESFRRLEHNESQQGLLLKMVKEQWV
jgi:SNF2 family DNA or RNA helicase